MALPAGFLDELSGRISLAAVVARKVSWDQRKSNPSKGDYWAPCPFHTEKTASFHVDDRKGYYYCFGCHAKGNAFAFVRETENVGFMEAVEILAREAGMPMPQSDPRAREKADHHSELARVMEMAVAFYRLQLKTGRASAARTYLSGRRLSEATQDQFELGYAPDDWTSLLNHLRAKSVPDTLIIECGLATAPESGKGSYDRFRDRIMFPIRDTRSRCIGFGGRTMRADDGAKYLNSPETPLFDKGRTLYNHGPAREAAGKSGRLIVAEGYMDVIALAQAGFADAVAPLGTAITETQLQMIWRLCPEPTIALDGDNAGVKAAMRLADLALPLLEAGKGLRFCILPEGLDPDEVIRNQGTAAMQDILQASRPMVDLIWQRETEDQVFDSPERRAALDTRLKATLATIRDPRIRVHYEAEIRARRKQMFLPPTSPAGRARELRPGNKRFAPPQSANAATRASLLARSADAGARIRETVILVACLNHPQLSLQFESQLEKLSFQCADLDEIRRQLLTVLHQDPDADRLGDRLNAATGQNVLANLSQFGHVRANRYVQPGADADVARLALLEELTKQAAVQGLKSELRDGEEELSGTADEGVTWRLAQASQAASTAMRAQPDESLERDRTEESLSRHLQDKIDAQIWVKKRK